MEITQQCVVALTWTLKDTLGETLDVLDEPVEFLVGGDDLFDVIEAALQGHSAGATINLHVEPEQGFGDFNDQLIFFMHECTCVIIINNQLYDDKSYSGYEKYLMKFYK